VLTIQPARRRRAGTGKLAIALAGGGPLGAFYELGALHALSEGIEGRDLTDFDVYVGVSSGSLVAAGLANGLDTTSMGATFIHDESTLVPFSPQILLQPAIGEYARWLAMLPQALLDAARQYMKEPIQSGWPTLVGAIARIVPTALFENAPLERYLRKLFTSRGHTDDFRKLRAQLYVVATNLNTGNTVVFGDKRHRRVPISRAVVASAALPGLYPSVIINRQHYVDGALIRTVHASLALEAGCDLLICINPLVPFDASRARDRRHSNLAHDGLPVILSQTFRALIYSRMHVGMSRYSVHFPYADTLLLEPERNDERLFFTNVFRYTGRHRLVEHAYQCTRRDLLAQAEVLAPLLARRGLELNEKRLKERGRTFTTAARERSARARQTTHRLNAALSRLDSLLSAESRSLG
jgi:predicted acylesterase/phospholipase RssA